MIAFNADQLKNIIFASPLHKIVLKKEAKQTEEISFRFSSQHTNKGTVDKFRYEAFPFIKGNWYNKGKPSEWVSTLYW